LLPRGHTLYIDGAHGVGKTSLALDIGRRVLAGREVLGHRTLVLASSLYGINNLYLAVPHLEFYSGALGLFRYTDNQGIICKRLGLDFSPEPGADDLLVSDDIVNFKITEQAHTEVNSGGVIPPATPFSISLEVAREAGEWGLLLVNAKLNNKFSPPQLKVTLATDRLTGLFYKLASIGGSQLPDPVDWQLDFGYEPKRYAEAFGLSNSFAESIFERTSMGGSDDA